MAVQVRMAVLLGDSRTVIIQQLGPTVINKQPQIAARKHSRCTTACALMSDHGYLLIQASAATVLLGVCSDQIISKHCRCNICALPNNHIKICNARQQLQQQPGTTHVTKVEQTSFDNIVCRTV